MSRGREDRAPDRGSWLFRGPETDAGGPETGIHGPHLDDEALAALLEGSTLEDVDEATREHLARCDRCRREWLELLDAAESVAGLDRLERVPRRLERRAVARSDDEPRQSPFAWLAWLMPSPALAGALAALLIATGLVLLLPVPDPGPGDGIVRSEAAGDSVELLRPRSAVDMSAGPVFDWTPVPGATGYEIVVADPARGSEVVLRLRADRPPRVLGPDERARLLPGRPYRWLLRVERGAGRVDTSDPVGFVLSH